VISCLRLWGTLRVWLSPDEKLGFPATCPPSSETAVAEIYEFGVGSSLLPGLVNVYKKRTGKIHHAIHGKINYFDWAMASSSQTVNVITRGYMTKHEKTHRGGIFTSINPQRFFHQPV